MLGPTSAELGPRVRVPRTAELDVGGEVAALWSHLESLGEFDRITVTLPSSAASGSLAATMVRELERQGLRPVRGIAAAELCWSHVIRRVGVELVLAPGVELESSLFLDGAHVPGLALGRHRFRKGRTYSEYVAQRVLDRKGPRGWNRRLARVVTEVLGVWNPSTLYLACADVSVVDLDPVRFPNVVVVPQPPDLHGAVALWQR
ncbi:MAG: chromosome partitioning protein ParA [Myxococcales bacterium]|nr:chromosome partitioning protein ParA [Myxococcales bacterium]